MSQNDIHDFLGSKPTEWFSVRELGVALNASLGSMNAGLHRMRRNRCILFKQDVRMIHSGAMREVTVYKYKKPERVKL